MRWLAVLLAGCVTEHVAVTPHELLRHVPELRDQGHAEVEVADGGTYELSADRTFDVTIAGKRTRLAVRDMVAGCPDVAPFAGAPPSGHCLLENTTIDHFELDTRHHFDW